MTPFDPGYMVVCFIIALLGTIHIHSVRSIDRDTLIGMVILSVIPGINLMVSFLVMWYSIMITIGDVITAFRRD